jgi:hypothetical protein
MKRLSLILLILVAVFVVSCEKDKENVMLKDTITANDLSNLSATTFVLLMDNASQTFQTFTWTEIDYGFNAVVKYDVEIDVKGNSFGSPVNVLSVTDATTASITVGAFNTILLNAGLEPEVAKDLEFRVKGTVNPGVPPVYSDVVEAKVTPYATTFPPIYMTGEATGGWNWNLYTYKVLKSTAPSVYETIAYFLNDKTFRFFKQPDWNPTSWNYPWFSTVDPDLVNANDGDLNFRVAAATGYYKIIVNMKTKTVTMEPVPDQVLYATGAALGGWNWDTDFIQLTWLSDGIYRATTDFANETFRFFGQAGWGPISYNYPWFTTVSPLFENANDGDKNFRFIGTPGSFTVTVNLLDKTVTMTQP